MRHQITEVFLSMINAAILSPQFKKYIFKKNKYEANDRSSARAVLFYIFVRLKHKSTKAHVDQSVGTA